MAEVTVVDASSVYINQGAFTDVVGCFTND